MGKKLCCNPLQQEKHVGSTKNLQPPTRLLLEFCKGRINSDELICMQCRILLYRKKKDGKTMEQILPDQVDGDITATTCVLEVENFQPQCEDIDESYQPSATTSTPLREQINSANSVLETISESPITTRKLRSKYYKTIKIKRVARKLGLHHISDEDKTSSNLESDLKTCVANATTRRDKVKFLTVAVSMGHSTSYIVKNFQTTKYLALRAKRQYKSFGLLSSPCLITRKRVKDDIKIKVTEFYNLDESSKQMPGMRDRVLIREYCDGKMKKNYVPARMLLDSLKNLYIVFKEQHPEVKISLTTFCRLRPKNVIFSSLKALRSCLCITCENSKLLFKASKLKNLTKGKDIELLKYTDCINLLVCDSPSDDCYFGICPECPVSNDFQNKLIEYFEEAEFHEFSFQKWSSVENRCELQTLNQQIDDFVSNFVALFQKLKTHKYLANVQLLRFKNDKANLVAGQIVIVTDFSENYNFVVQDEVQSAHWNSQQCTVYCCVLYYEDQGEIKHLSHVTLSACLKHDVYSANYFVVNCINEMKGLLPWTLKKVTVYSDGAPSQFKNFKNKVNLLHLSHDLGVEKVLWRYFATSHGKNACDGLGGSVKSVARIAAVRRESEFVISTVNQLYDFLVVKMPKVTFRVSSEMQINQHRNQLDRRYRNCKKMPGIRQYHDFEPIGAFQVRARLCSYSENSKLFKMK